MKKPVVDYRTFRLSKINEPQFSHLKLLLGWIVYFILFVLTENLIPAEDCTPMHCWLDDVIPFCEAFVIPYVFWYLLIIGSLGYFLLYDIDSFRNLQKFIILTQLIAMAIYIIFPSRQDLRPAEFPRDNVLTSLVGLIYSVDTNTGVCPSLHVAYSIGIASAWLKEKTASLPFKAFIVFCAVIISLSTAFIKQHSVVDIFAATLMCIVVEGIVYGKAYWRGKLKKQ